MTRPRKPSVVLAPEPRQPRARGFTLLEVMAALLIASILAAVALPTMTTRMRDRRAQQYAQEMALFYREGRARAIGRGSAHLVRYTISPDPHGQVQLLEAVQAIGAATNVGSCENLPRVSLNSCAAVDWNGGTQARLVSTMNSRGKLYEEVFATFLRNGGAEAVADVCFTPGGRSFLRNAVGAPFQPFNAVQKIRVMRQKGYDPTFNNSLDRLARDILLLPNGTARVETVVVP